MIVKSAEFNTTETEISVTFCVGLPATQNVDGYIKFDILFGETFFCSCGEPSRQCEHILELSDFVFNGPPEKIAAFMQAFTEQKISTDLVSDIRNALVKHVKRARKSRVEQWEQTEEIKGTEVNRAYVWRGVDFTKSKDTYVFTGDFLAAPIVMKPTLASPDKPDEPEPPKDPPSEWKLIDLDN